MQRGTIVKHHGTWALRYYETVLKNDGRLVRKKSFKRLAPVCDEYPNKRSVLLLADKILAPINAYDLPESSVQVVDFIENVFLPHVENNLRPATLKHYKKDLYEKHLKKLLAHIKLRDFRTVTGQRIIRLIPPPKASNATNGRTVLLRSKAFLSSVFKHAKREGFFDGENPMRDVSVPGKSQKKHQPVYTMSEIEKIATEVDKHNQQAAVVISVAAFTGLRMSELRGLRWSDYEGENLSVKRSMWRTHLGPTKTDSSASVVPVLPLLRGLLEEYRAKINPNPDDFMFAGPSGKSLNLPNVARKIIIPALNKADEPLHWKGWHAFRRSLASNLYEIGVTPKVIQAIMRHSDIGTTLDFYVQTPANESREALQKIEDWIRAI